jgi:hypothetical protein
MDRNYLRERRDHHMREFERWQQRVDDLELDALAEGRVQEMGRMKLSSGTLPDVNVVSIMLRERTEYQQAVAMRNNSREAARTYAAAIEEVPE